MSLGKRVICALCWADVMQITRSGYAVIRYSPLHKLQAILKSLPVSAVLAQAPKTGEPSRQARVPADCH